MTRKNLFSFSLSWKKETDLKTGVAKRECGIKIYDIRITGLWKVIPVLILVSPALIVLLVLAFILWTLRLIGVTYEGETSVQNEEIDLGTNIDREALLADQRLVLKRWGDGEFSKCRHDYIAFFEGEVLESGNDSTVLRKKWAGAKGVPVHRIVIQYVGE